MANINKELNQIKNAVYGKDVRQAIHDGIEKAYNDATSGGAGDTNLEVVLARGNYDSLNKRLDASDSQLAETEDEIESLETSKMDKSIGATKQELEVKISKGKVTRQDLDSSTDANKWDLNDFNEESRQAILESNEIDINYVLGEESVVEENL